MLRVNFYNINAYNKQNNYFLSSLSTIIPDFCQNVLYSNYTCFPVIFGLPTCYSNEGDYAASGCWVSLMLELVYAAPLDLVLLLIFGKVALRKRHRAKALAKCTEIWRNFWAIRTEDVSCQGT